MKDTPTIIHDFYRAFQRQDAEGMSALYHHEAVFTDPVFGELKGKEVGSMWKMLLNQVGGEIQISYSDIMADESKGIARWEASYPFKLTGRIIRNKIKASFKFQDGKIIQHNDCFSLTRWFVMAFGTKGILMGIFPPARKKLKFKARNALNKFMKENR